MKKFLTLRKFDTKDYKKFFTAQAEITCLHAGFLLKGSLAKSDLFLTNRDGVFNIFLNKEKEIRCLKYGVKLYSNFRKYQKYIKEFKSYAAYANEYIIPKYHEVPNKMTKNEFKKVIKFIGKLWYYYGFTEFPYLDLAYKYAKDNNNALMQKNLSEISHFKFKARETVNSYWFENGVIQNILAYISNRYLENDDAKYLYIDELVGVFDSRKPNRIIINQRKKCYAAASIDGKIIRFSYKDATKFNDAFSHINRTNMIKGVPANLGRAKGRAMVVPMLNDWETIEQIGKIMKKGDILVVETTSPDIIALCRKACAIVADQGGMLSHAAVVSRELDIPCIVQTEVATRIFKTGDFVEVDAAKGVVRKIK